MNRPLGLPSVHSYNLLDSRFLISPSHTMSSSHQKKIIDRYYDNHDTIQSDKLSQIVSDLWLAQEGTNKTKLWGKAQVALMRMGVDANRVAKAVGDRNIEALAALVAEVDAKGKQEPTPGSPDALAAGGQANETEHIARGAVPVNETRTVKQMQADKASDGGFDSLERDNLKRAVKFFRKKLKNARRDDESRLGARYTTYGKTSGISAITPPTQFPAAVWEKLAEEGRLKKAGQGTYELPEG